MQRLCFLFVAFIVGTVWAQEDTARASAAQNYEQGLVQMMSGEMEAALLSFEAATQAAPDYAEAHLAIGDLHLHRGDFDKARRAYERTLQIQPHAPGAHLGLGHVVWQREQDSHTALELYRAALGCDPDHAEANYFTGKMLAAQNQPEAAMPFLEKAIRLAPQAYEPHLSLGLCYLSQRQYAAATAQWQAAKNNGGFPQVLLEWSHNVLATVAENGILCTTAELETYPLWYLQECQGLRRDVHIVNLNLLQEVWYIQMLRDRAPALDIRFEDEYLAEHLRERLLSAPEKMAAAGLQWIWTPQPGHHLLRVQEVMLLKIIEWNGWQRPFYFAITVDRSEQLGLQDYLSMEGLAWRLCRTKCEPLQVEKTWENVREQYSYDHVKEMAMTANSPALLANYGKLVCWLADEFHQRRAYARTRSVLAWADSAGVLKDAESNECAARLANNLGEKMRAAKFRAQAAILRRNR